jgi:outer membrane protein insertion porin family
VIRRIEFVGLRRIPAATLRTQIRSRIGQALDAELVEEDVRALDRLVWFDSVTAEVHPMPVLLAAAETGAVRLAALLPAAGLDETGLRLEFVVAERPFLAAVRFRGSRALSRERISALLEEKRIELKVAAPARREDLWRATRAIEAALADAGHPEGRARLRLEEVPTAAVRATFEISDGPAVAAGRVTFAGNRAFSERKLRRQMKHIAPDARLAGLRGKKIYTRERLAEDLERLESFYRNHGYPEARVGQPAAEVEKEHVRHLLPWPHWRTAPRFHISIPVEEGRAYRLGAVEVRDERAPQKAGEQAAELAVVHSLKKDEPYSQEKLDRAREALERSRAFRRANGGSLPPQVGVAPQFDPEAGAVRVVFGVREPQPYIVRRIEFAGQKRFSDRYYRRRILLKEGEPLDTAKLEAGLEQLARTGFIRPVKRRDIRLRLDEQHHTAELTIRVEEIGRQKISLVGGHAPLGSTIGLVYNVFDLFGGEELITAHLEGGPESLQVLLGVAKEGVFGTRASLGLSVFQNLLRPNLPGASGRQRLFTSRSSGLAVGSSYPLTPRDTLGLNYVLSRSSTQYNLNLPSSISGLVNNQLRGATSSRSLGLTAAHDAGRQRLDASASVSVGWLGGNENLLRSSLEYSRLLPDPFGLNQGRRTGRMWAFRGYFAGVSSYRGELPLQARLFPGEELVRGFRTGELAPYALVSSTRADGSTSFRAQSPGADLVGGVNAEYRVPVMPRTEVAAFFDAGSGWLLPGWLGPNRPTLLEGTSGALRSSTGIEMRWRVPGLEQPLRVHYAFNPLRLSRGILFPDGTRFQPPNRRTALGWAFGSVF